MAKQVVQLCQEPDCQRMAVASVFFQHPNGQWCQHNYCRHHVQFTIEEANKRNVPVSDQRSGTQYKGHA